MKAPGILLGLLVTAALPAQEPPTLEPGKPLEGAIAGGEKRSYAISLEAGQHATVTIAHHGVHVLTRLFGPDSKLLVRVGEETFPEGSETLEFVAAEARPCRIEMEAEFLGTGGRYRVTLGGVRAATEQDRLLFEVETLRSRAAVLMTGTGQFDRALPLLERATHISEGQLGPSHPEIARVLDWLGWADYEKGDYEKAEAAERRAVDMFAQTLGPEHPETIAAKRRLGSLYATRGDYDDAEKLLGECFETVARIAGADDGELAVYLRELARLHLARGEGDRAIQEMEKSLAIGEKSLGPDHPDLGMTLNNLGMLYNTRKEFQSAEPLLERALAIEEKEFGEQDLALALPLQNLGMIAQEFRHDWPRALQYYWRAEAIQEKARGPEHPRVAELLNNIANVYKSTGDYKRAVELHTRCYAIWEKALGPYHANTLLSLGNLARTYAGMGDIPNAVKFQALTDTAIEKNLTMNLAIGSERQKLAYFESLSDRTDRTISLHVKLAPDNPAARDLAVLVILQRKGRVLDAMSNTMALLRQQLDAPDRALLDELNTTTAKVARLALSGPQKLSTAEYRSQLQSGEAQKEKLEEEIARRSASFRAQSQAVTVEAVKAAIPADAALVEFAVYRPFDPRAIGNESAYGEPRYIAYILRAGAEAGWRDLGLARPIDAAVAALRQAVRDPERKDVRELARAADEKIMRPVRALCGSARHLLISPDGPLDLIPMETLIDERGRYLVERYSISYLTSGRDLLRLQVSRNSLGPPLILADPWFGEPGSAGAQTRGNSAQSLYFAPLSATAQEAAAIQSRFPDARVLTGRQATKTALEQANAPEILHIATHGFFLDANGGGPIEGTRAISARARIGNPLLRSGLALAGANLSSSRDDGVLTALEASGLNLWGTRLVTLSACDTGVGEVRNGEGVYGLRRAFVVAGAETLVMSLWAISDYVTREVMTGYYNGLKRGLGRAEALRQAQLAMLQHKERQHPFYWAGFIASGDWRSLNGR